MFQAWEYGQVIRAFSGAYTLDDLAKMPYQKYQVVRRAAELIELQVRLQMITDLNAAYNGTQEYIRKLEQQLQTAQGSGIKMTADKNWASRLRSLMR